MAENEPKKGRREQFGERLKTKYPDREFADDEALFGQIDDDYAEYDKQLGEYKDREARLTDLFEQNPKAAQFITDMAKGNDPWVAVLERMGIDGITDIINNPEKKEEYAEANKKFVESVAKNKELEDEYNINIEESMAMLQQMQQERGLSDEQIDAAIELIDRITHEQIVGKYTPETIEMALKAINHDAEVANARTEGEVAGRNAKIDEKLRKPQSGDGVPVMAGSNNGTAEKTKRPLSIFDYAEAAN